jgi:hypothetical protein
MIAGRRTAEGMEIAGVGAPNEPVWRMPSPH